MPLISMPYIYTDNMVWCTHYFILCYEKTKWAIMQILFIDSYMHICHACYWLSAGLSYSTNGDFTYTVQEPRHGSMMGDVVFVVQLTRNGANICKHISKFILYACQIQVLSWDILKEPSGTFSATHIFIIFIVKQNL